MKNLKIIVSIWLILLVTSVAFSPSLKNEFTNWDDDVLVTGNTDIRNLSWRSIKKIFSSFYNGTYIPLTLLSYSTEYHFFKLKPYVYHTTNLILHLLNGSLVFWLIFLLSGKVLISIIVSLLFCIHPLHVEPVAWVTGRKDVLYSFFFLSAIISYLYYQKKQVVKYYWFSLGLFIFSALAKGVAITIPLILLLCDYLLGRKFDRKIVKEKIPYFGIGVIFGIIAIFAQFSIREMTTSPPIISFQNIGIASYGLLFYLIKMVLPIRLSCLYPPPEGIKVGGMFPPVFLFSLGIVAILIALVIFSGKYTRKIIYGSLFFLVTILLLSELIPVQGLAIAADRYTYIPLIGMFYILGEGFSLLYERKIKSAKMRNFFLLTVLLGVMGRLSFLTWQRCGVWKDSIILWNDVLKNYPNVPIAYNNRGNAYREKGEYAQAISDYNQALKINPIYAEAYNNRAVTYWDKREYDNAISDCNQALKINPNLAEAYYNRGNAYLEKREYDNAISDYNQALKINPDYAEAYNNRGVTYWDKGEYAQAISEYNQALKINPNYAEAYKNRAVTYWDKREYDNAISDCNQALKINPNYAEAYYNRGNAYLEKREYDNAISEYNQALKINPDYAEAYNNRAVTYWDKREYVQSISDCNQALKINPNYAKAYNNRGNAYREKGEYAQAISDYNQALKINPNYAEAYYNRAVTYLTVRKYDSAGEDILKMHTLGYQINPRFLDLFRKSSER